MAKIDDNLLVKFSRGNVGKQFVFKRRGESTHIAKMPAIKKNAVVTNDQLKARDLFAAASLYAQGAMSSPVLKNEYQKKATGGRTAANVAFRDYLLAPVVTGIETDNYDGNLGSTVVVGARDDFRVASVKVSIHDAGGTLIEQGNAVLNAIDRSKWTYTATQVNASPPGCTVSAEALDLPGNRGKLEKTI
jgi:hypothetical protein